MDLDKNDDCKMKKIMKSLLLTALAALVLTGCSQRKQSKKAETPSAPTLEAKAEEGKVSTLTTAEFKKKIMDYEKHPQEWVFEGTRPVIIDFYATWCHPCKMTAPVVEQLAKDYLGKIDFYKVDIDKEQELAATFGIQSIPTFLFIPVKGKPTAQMGAMQKEDFEKIIKSVIFK